MARRVPIEALESELRTILEEYGDSISEGTTEAVTTAAQTAQKQLKAVSPAAGGNYARGWRVQIERGRLSTVATIYNGKKPGLAHLLEFGHVLRNGTGRSFGEGGARPHIAGVEAQVVADFEKAVAEVIQK